MASIFFNGGDDGRELNQGGHSTATIIGGRGMIDRYAMNGAWGGYVDTFSTSNPYGYGPDGNRGPAISRNARYWHMERCVINRNGSPPDTSPPGICELLKLEGRDNTVADCALRNSVQMGLFGDSATWSAHASGNRVCHTVFDRLNGPVANMTDWLDGGRPGDTRLSDYQFKNCIFRHIAQNEYSSWTDHVLVLYVASGVSWQNVIQMHGITVQDATRNADSFYVTIAQGISPPGTRSLTYMLANYPANFSNWTFTSSEVFTNAPSASTDIMPSEISTYYTPVTTANGVDLTLANGAGVATTTLVVDDSRWFTDPRYGTSPQIHINGVGNRSYTAINYATHTITLSAVATWADNAPINRAITSGATPNRGAVR
jgi:hypothetical protein